MKHMFMAVTAAAGLLAASTAGAVTVVGATHVQISSAIAWTQVAEVVATQYGTGINVAASANGGVASAPDQYSGVSGPTNANDGNTAGNYYLSEIYHSANPFGTLNINFAPATLSSLTIWGRTDCCSDRDLFNVSIYNRSNTLLYSGVIDARNGSGTVSFGAPGGVPEAATWAMMIAGFGMVGATMRRRQAIATA